MCRQLASSPGKLGCFIVVAKPAVLIRVSSLRIQVSSSAFRMSPCYIESALSCVCPLGAIGLHAGHSPWQISRLPSYQCTRFR